MAKQLLSEDPLEDLRRVPLVYVDWEGTDEVADLMFNDFPDKAIVMHVASYFPNCFAHPGLDKYLW